MIKNLKKLYYFWVPNLVQEMVTDFRFPQRALKNVVKLPFQEKKSVFIHIPKVAGTSISEAVYGYDIGHHTLSEILLREPSLASAYKFGFVRDPLTRLFSTYHYLVSLEQSYPGSKYGWVTKYSSFEDFVEYGVDSSLVENDRFFYTQVKYLVDSNYKLDFIGRFENIAEDFSFISARLDCSTLPHKRKNKNALPEISATCRDKVFRLYKEDYLEFGYDYSA